MKDSLLNNIFFSFLILLFITSCDDNTINETFGTSILDTMSNEKIGHSTRTFIEKEEEKTSVSFIVIHNGDLTKMVNDENSALKALIETYNLEVQKPFEIDTENRGFILVTTTILVAPIEVGKEISLINEVLMVEVDNETKKNQNPS